MDWACRCVADEAATGMCHCVCSSSMLEDSRKQE